MPENKKKSSLRFLGSKGGGGALKGGKGTTKEGKGLAPGESQKTWDLFFVYCDPEQSRREGKWARSVQTRFIIQSVHVRPIHLLLFVIRHTSYQPDTERHPRRHAHANVNDDNHQPPASQPRAPTLPYLLPPPLKLFVVTDADADAALPLPDADVDARSRRVGRRWYAVERRGDVEWRVAVAVVEVEEDVVGRATQVIEEGTKNCKVKKVKT